MHAAVYCRWGNDRVLVFKTIPTQNGATADVVLGEPDEFSNATSNATLAQSATDITATPTSLAWDGQNLYVPDSTNYRIMVFTPEVPNIPLAGIVNDASRAVTPRIGGDCGTITEKNTVTVTIAGTGYTYTVKANDTLENVAKGLTALITAPTATSSAGDPNVTAFEEPNLASILLVARQPGPNGNLITVATSTSPTHRYGTCQLNVGRGERGAACARNHCPCPGGQPVDSSASADPKAPQLPWNSPELSCISTEFARPVFSVSDGDPRATPV